MYHFILKLYNLSLILTITIKTEAYAAYITEMSHISEYALSSAFQSLENVFMLSESSSLNTSCATHGYVHLNGSCYKYVSTPLNFNEANGLCADDFGHLVDIHSAEEQNLVWQYINSVHDFSTDVYFNGPFIGLSNSKSNGNGVFEWVTNEPMNYLNWAANYPKSEINYSYCAILGSSGFWETIPCEWEKAYICKIPLKSSQSWVSRYISDPVGIYIAIPFILVSLGLIFYFASCTYNKRSGKVLKSIKLKLPKLSLPFNKKMRDYRPYDDDADEVQFNCFGPDDSSEHGLNSETANGALNNTKLRLSRVV